MSERRSISYIFIGIFSFNCFFNLSAQTWEPVGDGVIGSDIKKNPVEALYVYHGRMYIGGKFDYSGNKRLHNIACWNGKKIDTVGIGIDSLVSCFTEYKGNLCIGGYFHRMVQLEIAANIISWNDSTGKWKPIDEGFEGATDRGVYPIMSALYSYHGDLYAGGGWYMASGTISGFGCFAKWTGQKWVNVASKSKTLNSPEVRIYRHCCAMAIYNDKLYVGGEISMAEFTQLSIGLVGWNGKEWTIPIRRLKNDSDRSMNLIYSKIFALCVYKKDLYVGGVTNVGNDKNITAYGISKWNDTTWTLLSNGIRGTVFSMAVYHDKLYVGGRFDSAGGEPAHNIAVWDGKAWSGVGEGLELKDRSRYYFRGAVMALVVYKNHLYVGGAFDHSGKTALSHLAVLNDEK